MSTACILDVMGKRTVCLSARVVDGVRDFVCRGSIATAWWAVGIVFAGIAEIVDPFAT